MNYVHPNSRELVKTILYGVDLWGQALYGET